MIFAVIDFVLAETSLNSATRQARLDATYQARLAAAAVGDALQQGAAAVAGLSRGLDISSVTRNPTVCNLSFSGLGAFTEGHIDVVLTDGRVPCSSVSAHGAPAGANQAGAPWLAGTSSLPSVSATFTDRLTGKPAVAVSATVTNATKEATGLIAVVLPLDDLASGLAETYGGPAGFAFAVTDSAGQHVLSAAAGSATVPMPVLGSRRGWIEAAAPVPGLGWQVVAGRRASAALAATRSLLLKETGLALAALLVLLGLLTVVNRKIGTPLLRLTEAVGRAAGTPALCRSPRMARWSCADWPTNSTTPSQHVLAFEDQLSHDALHDQLTGLPNQALLLDRLAVTLMSEHHDAARVGLLAVGIDRFELVNTNLGYGVGDVALTTIAQRLAGALRPGQTVARLGGGEFAIALELTDRESALAEAGAALVSVAQPIEASGNVLALTASVGVALADPRTTAEELLRNATTAMHTAKEHGGARHRIVRSEPADHRQHPVESGKRPAHGARARRVASGVSARGLVAQRPYYRRRSTRAIGPTRRAGRFRRPPSFRWPRRPVSSNRSAVSFLSKRARRPSHGVKPVSRCYASPSTCRVVNSSKAPSTTRSPASCCRPAWIRPCSASS